jgi:hypothetical protein
VAENFPDYSQALLGQSAKYKRTSRNRTNQIFEKIDLSNISSITLFQNILEPIGSGTPITLYEIQGPAKQGAITYLNIKLAFVSQMDANESLNETGQFGINSFFYNDASSASTVFMLTQVGDNLYGFQYSKADAKALEDIKEMINTLTLLD